MTLISNFCSEIQRWVWVFNIKSQSNSWAGSFCVSRLASCLTPRDASIHSTISWSHDLKRGLENGSCAPRQFTRFQSLCFTSSYCSSRQKSSMWKWNCIEIPGFRPEMAVCAYVMALCIWACLVCEKHQWFVWWGVDNGPCSAWSEQSIQKLSQMTKGFESNQISTWNQIWVRKKRTASWATWRSSLLQLK